MFFSRHMNWNGVWVEQCQSPASAFEMELPALSDHWLYFHTGDPAALVQKRNDRLHETILHEGGSFLVPAGQPSYWCQAPDMSNVIVRIWENLSAGTRYIQVELDENSMRHSQENSVPNINAVRKTLQCLQSFVSFAEENDRW